MRREIKKFEVSLGGEGVTESRRNSLFGGSTLRGRTLLYLGQLSSSIV